MTDRRGTPHDPLAGGGEMGALMRSIDWAHTAVGPVDTWPQSLRTALSILLETGFPMYIAWGADFTQFYNDGYRPILGATKHPAAMGISTRETFAEIWNIIGPMFHGVMAGQPTTLVDFLLPLDRFGFAEECYFVLSYSPIREESGGVGGVLVTVSETTARVLGARRLATLQALAADTRDARQVTDACRIAAAVLSLNANDLPFARIYLVDRDQRQATLGGVSGPAPEPTPAAPIDLAAGGEWPLGEVVRSRTAATVDGKDGRALILPVMQQGADRALGVLVAGVSPRLVLDEDYRSFLALVAAHLGTAIASAEALEEARARADALAELDRAKTAFFSNVSHEFRTPLTLILGPLTQTLHEAHALPPAVREQLTVAHRNSLRLLKLVNTLLEFSRIEAGRVQARFEAVDLCALTTDLVSTFRSAMDAAGLSLAVECEPPHDTVYVDRDMWEQIVLNLVSNAFKFTLDGGVTVSVRQRGPVAELVVRDTGVGIPGDELPRVFERFHRVEGTRGRSHEGSGIGLALVHELVKLHAGDITVASEVGRGTTFTVAIPTGVAHLPAERVVSPRTDSPAPTMSTAFVEEALRWLSPAAEGVSRRDEAVMESAAAPASREDPHILVADDNADMRDYARRLLAERWHVETVSDGEAALRAARRRRPDVIVTDVMMPGLDGFGLIRELRASPDLRMIPVIVLSARAGDDARIEGLAHGADDYLAKPFTARDLLTRVEAQLLKGRMRSVERVQAQRLEHMFACAPVGIAVLRGPEHVFELANPMYVDLVGRPVAGLTIREAFPDLAGQGIYDLLDGVRSTRLPYVGRSVPLTLNRDGGTDSGYFDFVYQPLVDDRGEVDTIVVVVHEVTALVTAREAAERSDRLKDEFLATLSHELRTPLNAVLGYTQMLRGGVIKPDRQAAVLETIERNALAQQQLIEDVLDVSRIVTGKMRIDVQPVDLGRVIDDALETVTPAANAKGVRLQPIIDRAGARVAGDAQRLQQVIWNLLSNAVKFTPRGGRVQVRLQRVNSHIELTVSDTGEGIAPEFLPFLFERFRQADSALSRTHGGLGLGLAISRHLVEAHGGRIDAASPGKGAGTTIRIELPLMIVHHDALDAADRAHPRSDVLPGGDLTLDDLTGVRVLLVDDDRDALQMAKDAVAAAGASVETAGGATEALATLDRQSFDVLILDIGLPDVDGYELLRRIRQRPFSANGNVPAAALTAYARVADRTRSLQAGFQRHLGKPVRPTELVAAIRSLANMPNGT
jgi:signal transduction histidine kinase/DNA-binding response OmpR family regulator